MKAFDDPALEPGRLPRVAVVGSGIAGLATAWLLSREYPVTLFEAEPRLGGHTHTVDVQVEGRRFPVDTGFLVFNERTYPELCALFRHLEVEAVPSEMSFAVSLDEPDLEWSGTDLSSLFAQPANLLRPGFWQMLRDLLRFNRETTAGAQSGSLPDISLGEYLARGGYGAPFRDWYLLPMAAAIWSCPTRTMMDYPIATFARFCHNHGLLQIFDRPRWLTVRNGGRSYVDKLYATLPDVRTGCPIRHVHRDASGVRVLTDEGESRFDQLVLACHSDQALALLGRGACVAEQAVLGAIRYQPNRAVLHLDTRLLPRRPAVWSAWNYQRGAAGPDGQRVSVTYLLNRLQPLPVQTPVMVTLNPVHEPDPSLVLGSYDYAHPVFDAAAIQAQQALGSIQGERRTWFAGAWTGYGFHEDGLRSALAVADALGVRAPWRHRAVPAMEVA